MRYVIAKDYKVVVGDRFVQLYRVYDDELKSFCEPMEMASGKKAALARAKLLNERPLLKYRVYFINFNYHAQEEFSTPAGALEYGKSKCFEFAIQEWNGKVMVKTISAWSPIGGLKNF